MFIQMVYVSSAKFQWCALNQCNSDVIYTLPDHGLWFGESLPEMGRQMRLWTSDEGLRRKPGFYLQHGPHPRSWLRHQGIHPSMVQWAPPVSVRYRFLWRSMSLHSGKISKDYVFQLILQEEPLIIWKNESHNRLLSNLRYYALWGNLIRKSGKNNYKTRTCKIRW